MPTISMVDKDFAEWYKNYVAEGQSVSLWEQALTGLQSAYKPQISAVQQSSAYDISQAYANYKKSQLNLMQAQQLGTGLKEQLSSGLGQQYQSAYQQAKTKESQQLASLTSAYAEDVSTIEKQFSQFGETASQLQKALFEYASSGAGEITPSGVNYEHQRAFIPESEGGLGYYSLSEDGTYELTEAGEAFYDKLLGQYTTKYNTAGERVTTSFGDWLLENKDYAELGGAYAENPALFAEAFGGRGVSDLEYTTEETQTRRKSQIDKSLGVENSETILNELTSTLTALNVIQQSGKAGAYIKDPDKLKSDITSKLNIDKNAIEIGWIADKTVDINKQSLRIDIKDNSLDNGQRFALEDLGFKLVDGVWRYTKLSNTTEPTVNDFFAR